MVIQVVLLVAVVAVFAVFVRNSHTVRAQAVKRIGFVLFIIASCYAVLRPNDTTTLAHHVGVGRGADLLLYLLVAAFAFFAVNTYLRFRNLERRFTDLARSVALSQAVAPAASGGERDEAIAVVSAALAAPVAAAPAPVAMAPSAPTAEATAAPTAEAAMPVPARGSL